MILFEPCMAQNRKELESQRKKTEEEIALTKKILRDTRNKKQQNLREVKTISNLIEKREVLIETINQEIVFVNQDADHKKNEIEELNIKLDEEKKNYSRAILQVYKIRKVYNNSVFLFASKSFNQFVLRLKFTKYLNSAMEKFLFRIDQKKHELEQKLEELLGLKLSKEKLAISKQNELKELEQDKNEKNKVIVALNGKESELKTRLEKQKKAKENLNAQINAIIAREIAAARKKAEAQNKARKETSEGKTKETKPGKRDIELTPEAKQLSEGFESNKGKLPWPVEKGFISERFGTHAHEKLDQVTVQNNGIDIQTSSGSSARCVYKGTVSAVISVPGMGKAVIVNHGEYFSVYSKLKDVSVKSGEVLSIKQNIGNIMEDEDGATEIHLEIWYNQEKQNPELWIAR